MEPTRSGIPTVYRNTKFRSRLEARWAAFFDLVELPWVYEPFDVDGYIPDFLLTGSWPLLVEIGPCVTPKEYWEKTQKPDAAAASLGLDILIGGVVPMVSWMRHPQHVAAGPMGEYGAGVPYMWAPGFWGRCLECRSLGVVHAEQSYCLRPCGHHQSGGFGEVVSSAWLDAAWRTAGSDVQWIAKRPERLGEIITDLALSEIAVKPPIRWR